LKLHENISLKGYNSFGLDVKARWFTELKSDTGITAFFTSIGLDQFPILILGGGSNILFTRDFPGTVACIRSKGIVKLMEDEHHVYLKVAAGEVWDDVVRYAVDHGWGGIENLSLIPGTMGAAPVQNIGAYGVEMMDVIYTVEVADIFERSYRSFRPADCAFGYRNSIFKTTGKDRLVITGVCLKLDKKPQLKLDYGDIQKELAIAGIQTPTIADVRDVVMQIRRRKLPDPAVTGNAGSFFKNPVVTPELLNRLKDLHPGIISHPFDDKFKLAAAWMIEQTGWKGRRIGDAGVHPGQPLVLVNYGKATGQEILHLASEIMDSVRDKFGVQLETEVNIL
jgi:UDP-N-acetylmuramate dehydrogenase